MSISGLTLRDGSAKYGTNSYGGAVYSDTGSGALNIVNAQLLNNSALYAGSAPPPVYVVAYGAGGAIAAFDTASVTITNTTLRNNSAGKYGGALAVGSTPTTITGSTLTSNALFPEKYFFALNGLGSGGAVFSDDGTLDVSSTTISGNSANNGAGIALYDTDPTAPTGLSIHNSEISRNLASTDGGAVRLASIDSPVEIQGSKLTGNSASARGGAIDMKYQSSDPNDAPVTISDSQVSGNTSLGGGGGAYVEDLAAPFDVTNSTFADNFSGYGGGAIDLDGTSAPAAEMTLKASTFSGNEATNGGGLYLRSDNPVTVADSTISDNSATHLGGGVYAGHVGTAYNGVLNINDSTIDGNTATGNPGSDGTSAGGGIYVGDFDGDVNLSSTVVADSAQGGDLGLDDYSGPSSGTGAFNIGFSLIEAPGSTPFAESPAGSNITGSDPALGQLADNGGPTQTQLPTNSSPVIDAGIANGLNTDQRGDPRTVDQPTVPNRAGSDGTDIGAVEIPLISSTQGECEGQTVAKQVADPGGSVLTGTAATDFLEGGAGDDTLDGLAKGDCEFGEDGNDHLGGDNGPDQLDGGGGNDRVKGGGGKDKIQGGPGNDKIAAGGGADKVAGNGGKDRVRGSEGGDVVKGGAGDDRLKGAGGDDRISGGGGVDRINCGTGDDVAIADKKDTVSSNCETVKRGK